VKRVERAGEHAEGRGARFALLAAENRQQGLALALVGSLVDDGLRFAMPFMDRPWPREQTDPFEAIQANVAEVALIDAHGHGGPAVSLRRQAVELAGAAPVAVAGGEFRAFDVPIDASHGVLRRMNWRILARPQQPGEGRRRLRR
jgi:hypothetical protein